MHNGAYAQLKTPNHNACQHHKVGQYSFVYFTSQYIPYYILTYKLWGKKASCLPT